MFKFVFLQRNVFYAYPKRSIFMFLFCTDLLFIFDILAQNGIRRPMLWFSVLNDGQMVYLVVFF